MKYDSLSSVSEFNRKIVLLLESLYVCAYVSETEREREREREVKRVH